MSFFDLIKSIFCSSSKKIPCAVITNTSPFSDNMNYYHYSYTGIFSKTNRRRKGDLYAFSDDEAIEILTNDGFVTESISLEKIPFRNPSEAQIELLKKMNIVLPDNACMEDVSAIISFYNDGDIPAPASLFSLADSIRIKISYYSGLYNLFEYMYCSFDIKSKIAFYIISVKHSKDNVWEFENFDYYMKLAEICLQDNSFMNSFKHNNYHNRFSGKIDSSSKLSCYKYAMKLL